MIQVPPSYRAAVIAFLLLEYRHHLETEKLEPLIIRNTIPLCMGQYKRTFKTTRSALANYAF